MSGAAECKETDRERRKGGRGDRRKESPKRGKGMRKRDTGDERARKEAGVYVCVCVCVCVCV